MAKAISYIDGDEFETLEECSKMIDEKLISGRSLVKSFKDLQDLVSP